MDHDPQYCPLSPAKALGMGAPSLEHHAKSFQYSCEATVGCEPRAISVLDFTSYPGFDGHCDVMR